jgi:hypothetical protein
VKLDAFGAIIETEEATEHTRIPVERFAAVFSRIRGTGAATGGRSSADATAAAAWAEAAVESQSEPAVASGTKRPAALNAQSDALPSATFASGHRRRAKKTADVLFDPEPFIASESRALVAANAWWRELLAWADIAPSSPVVPNQSERAQLLLSIESVRHPSHRAWLTELTRCAFDADPSADVRAAALRALAVLGFGEEDGQRFWRASDGSPIERQAAVETLAGHEFRVSWARDVLERLAC